MSLEWATRDAVRRPLTFHLQGRSLRVLIHHIVQAVPGYSVGFSEDLVDVYYADARQDTLNPFNVTIGRYDVANVDVDSAGAELLCALGRQLDPHSQGCGESGAPGQWGGQKITLHLRSMKVYEILNAIVAQNGRAVWTPIANFGRLGPTPTKFWYIYALDGPFESVALQHLESLFPRPARGGTR
jgi:hypothetical protein